MHLKCLEKLQGWVTLAKTWEKININISPPTLSDIEQQRLPNINSPYIYLWKHLKTTAFSALIANYETFHHRIFYAPQTIPFATVPGNLKRWKSTWSDMHWFRLRIFWIFVVYYDLINNNNTSFVKLEKCFITVVYRLYVKYYTVTVFFVESSISN